MRIAIIRLSSLGDIISTAVFLDFLRSSLIKAGAEKNVAEENTAKNNAETEFKAEKNVAENLHITWIVDSAFKGILADSPYISEICDIPLRESKKQKTIIFDIYKKLKKLEKFDLVLDFQGLLKSAIVGKILKSNDFIGYSKNGAREKIASIFYTKKAEIPYEEHILKRQYAILKTAFETMADLGAFGATKSMADFRADFNLKMLDSRDRAFKYSKNAENKINEILSESKSKSGKSGKSGESKSLQIKILFLPEASKIEKEYPLDCFYKVAQELKKAFSNLRIYLLWDKKKSEIADLAQKDSVFCLLPHLNFDEIKALVARMNLVIGGDTGITHLAWAMQTHSITLYGNTPIERFRLDGDNHISITKIKQNAIVKGDFSIREISQNEVAQSAKILLNKHLPNVADSAKDSNKKSSKSKESIESKSPKKSAESTPKATKKG
ncbi:lipopolysaccharide heptosyltransferase I [Helicobacter sp. 16-1353]|uniref:lipopolysaccharide heptosyltransferase I n=1 Tax=Helicobacter sp. 16-1353 TaxID=2004996 RepID=UPI000DCC8882|nr:lipopolysaccharide heptosyltransferase I [Helicobacter sp. 16-1353]RAX54836.1 lipopolysaccharide heptosyltransferase I [Helicobacter sp. 16-1353]